MKMTDWFLAELESEAGKSRRVLEQVPTGKRDFKPHERSMEMGYLCELVANISSWVGMAITLNELDIAPKDGPKYKPAELNTPEELVAALDKAVGQAREALQNTTDEHLATKWRLLAGGQLAFEQPRHDVIRDTFLHSAHHRGQLTVYLRLLGSKVPSVYGPTADDKSFG
jgi:uncharacterized damage-inducible protein DinB